MGAVIQEAGTTREGVDSSRLPPFGYSSSKFFYLYFSETGTDIEMIAGPAAQNAGDLLLLKLEEAAFSQLAEASFAEDWNSEADSVYDDL